jgi:hypothetical protein
VVASSEAEATLKKKENVIPHSTRGLQFGDLNHDCMRVTVKKSSDDDDSSGRLKVIKMEGKLWVRKLPNHEERIRIGDEVFDLAINGTRATSITDGAKAQALIDKSQTSVVLIINVDDQKQKLSCPCCGEAMNNPMEWDTREPPPKAPKLGQRGHPDRTRTGRRGRYRRERCNLV